MALKDYIKIARPDHWFKNVFLLPGFIIALMISHQPILPLAKNLIIGLISLCLTASANYVINEWLDRDFDRHHPIKKHRPSAMSLIQLKWVYCEYFLLSAAGLILASLISWYFFSAAVFLLIMGILYNVKPFRTKDRTYLDVISESINNPIRFTMGWLIVTNLILPPSSLLFAYWMGGAFLMSVKRYAEYQEIGDKALAGNYRRSFRFYNNATLLCSAMFYALCAAFFGGVFLVKYKLELLIALPFIAFMFVWYLKIGLKKGSIAQNPEKIYQEKGFLAYVLFVIILTAVCAVVDIPSMHFLLAKSFG